MMKRHDYRQSVEEAIVFRQNGFSTNTRVCRTRHALPIQLAIIIKALTQQSLFPFLPCVYRDTN